MEEVTHACDFSFIKNKNQELQSSKSIQIDLYGYQIVPEGFHFLP